MKVTLLIDVLITEERGRTGAQTNYLVIYCPFFGFLSIPIEFWVFRKLGGKKSMKLYI